MNVEIVKTIVHGAVVIVAMIVAALLILLLDAEQFYAVFGYAAGVAPGIVKKLRDKTDIDEGIEDEIGEIIEDLRR